MKNLIFRIILLATLLMMLPAGLAACKKAPGTTAPVTTTSSPTTKVTASPLTVLSIAGGDVLIMKPGDKEWSRGEIGMTLGINYKIKTEASGTATVTFFEGSVIELEGNTEISLSDLGLAGTTTTIKLKQTVGNTLSRVKKLADPASAYEVETPASVTAVRGTTVYHSVAINGTTIVGNIEGIVLVTAQGKTTTLTTGNHVTVKPGEPPGTQEPGAIPGTTVPPTTQAPPTTTTAPTTTAEPTTTVPSPSISASSELNQQRMFNGDTITITFIVSNTGTVPVSNVSVTDDKAGIAAYVSGDNNKNSILDTDEKWIFKVNYTIPASASGTQITTAAVSGKGPDNKAVNKTILTQINITTLMVQITSPNANTVVSETVMLAGTVNDPAVTQVTINQNGVVSSASVVNGSFSTSIKLMSGMNIITVTATRAGGATATAKIELQPVD